MICSCTLISQLAEVFVLTDDERKGFLLLRYRDALTTIASPNYRISNLPSLDGWIDKTGIVLIGVGRLSFS